MNPNAPLSDIMTQMPITIKPEATLAEINGIFEANNFHHIPVVDGGKLVGIISREDFLQMQHVLASNWNGRVTTPDSYQDFHAQDIMTEYPMHLGPDDSIGLAADIVLANKFRALPIIEDDFLIGIVTAHDLVAFAFASPIEKTSE